MVITTCEYRMDAICYHFQPIQLPIQVVHDSELSPAELSCGEGEGEGAGGNVIVASLTGS